VCACLRVCTDPEKVVEFKIEIFQALKVWKMIRGMEKSEKILENYEVDLENIAFHYTAFVTLLSLYIADILWSKFLYHIDIAKDDIGPSLLPAPREPPPQPFYGPFSGTTWVSRCQKRTSGLYGARED